MWSLPKTSEAHSLKFTAQVHLVPLRYGAKRRGLVFSPLIIHRCVWGVT